MLKKFKEIENYLKHEFEKYIPTDEETVFLEQELNDNASHCSCYRNE